MESQADIYESILFKNPTVWINTYICDLSFSKTALLKVLQNLRKGDAKTKAHKVTSIEKVNPLGNMKQYCTSKQYHKSFLICAPYVKRNDPN